MAFTKDKRYIIKELEESDHQSLLQITASFVSRIKGEQTLLSPIYMYYTDPSQGSSFMVMGNIFKHTGPFVGLYDLKGCDDDKTLEAMGEKVKAVHKRLWNLDMHLGPQTWSAERVTYYMGKVEARSISVALTANQRAEIMNLLRFDTDWLARNNLMDYSLLVGVKRMSWAEFSADSMARWAHLAPPGEFRQPLLYRVPRAS